MTLFDQIRRDHDRSPATGISGMLRWLRHRLPTGLYARSLLIIILPMLILQTVVAFVFMERHWQLVTERLSEAVTRDISAVIELIELYPEREDFDKIVNVAASRLNLIVSLEPGTELPSPRQRPFFSILDQILSDEIAEQIRRPFWIDTVGMSRLVEIRIVLEDQTLRIFASRNSAYASNTHIFLVWMVSTALVLIVISILFLRGQHRAHQRAGAGNGGKHAREELRAVEQQLEAVTAAPGKDHQRALKISTALTGTARLMAGKPARARRFSRPSAKPKSAAFSTSGARVTT